MLKRQSQETGQKSRDRKRRGASEKVTEKLWRL